MKKVKNIMMILILMASMLCLFETKKDAVNTAGNLTGNTASPSTQNNTNTGSSTPAPSTNTTNTTNTTNQNTTGTNSNTSGGEHSNNQNTTPNANNNTNNHNSNSTETSTTKSSNANLTTLGIKPGQYDFTGFNNNTLSYETKVPEEVETIEIIAILQDKKAKIEGIGTRTLEIGRNALEVIVTAEDGTTKTFTIYVTRGNEQEIEQTVDEKEGLENLSIEGISLSPSFQTNVYEYRVKYIGEATKLGITAEPTNQDYMVEITGNEDLQEGENTITILVSKSNGTNVATYQIIVNKSLIDEEAIAREKEEKEKEKRNRTIVTATIVGAVLAVGLVGFMIMKNRKDSETFNDEEDEEVVSLAKEEVPNSLDGQKKDIVPEKENEEETKEPEELPKALIGQKKDAVPEKENQELPKALIGQKKATAQKKEVEEKDSKNKRKS